MSAIHVEALVKKFGGFTALKTFDLKIANGEFMALLGPSGCGKSTTMNIIAGMESRRAAAFCSATAIWPAFPCASAALVSSSRTTPYSPT